MSHILNPSMPKPREMQTVDVLCRVIDNYGDAGVCLRLARSLALEHGYCVRLFCDDLALLQRLEPNPPVQLVFLSWEDLEAAIPAQGVINGFGCDASPGYLQRMADQVPPPKWLHLEYLSAESWVEGTHGLDSRHPRLPLTQRFISPGFTAATGGLLRDFSETMQLSEVQALDTLGTYGIAPAQNALRVLVFAYEYADFLPLVDAAQQLGRPVHWLLCAGAASEKLAALLEGRSGQAVSKVPFVSQQQFDALLRCAHRLWVRGEDSAVRALWSGVPSVWQLYAQTEETHLVKMDAYLDRLQSAAPRAAYVCVKAAHEAANQRLRGTAAQAAWAAWLADDASTQTVSSDWKAHLLQAAPDLGLTVSKYLRG